jgi:hypothetical protein
MFLPGGAMSHHQHCERGIAENSMPTDECPLHTILQPCSGIQHSIDRRPADLEGLRDLGCPEPLRLHCAHLSGIYRSRAALVDASGLGPRNPRSRRRLSRIRRTRRACRGSTCRRRCWCRSTAPWPSMKPDGPGRRPWHFSSARDQSLGWLCKNGLHNRDRSWAFFVANSSGDRMPF